MIFKIEKHITLTFESGLEIDQYYKRMNITYPKFFKMDNLSKMGIIASESILTAEIKKDFNINNANIILFNTTSSLETDTKHVSTIDSDNYYPSPSVFVYTLPNICAGEIAIRHKINGESSFYILQKCDVHQMLDIVSETMIYNNANLSIAGWIESFNGKHEVSMALINRIKKNNN